MTTRIGTIRHQRTVVLEPNENALLLALRGHYEAKTGENHAFTDIFRLAIIELAKANKLA